MANTITIKKGDTLYGLYGPNWKALSGYTGDPKKLQIGTVLPAPSGGAPSAPALAANLNQVQQNLNAVQNQTFTNYKAPDAPQVQTTTQILADVKGSGLLPTGQAPQAPSLVDTYGNLIKEKGVEAIQASITDLKAQQDELAAQLRVNVAAERGKPVATNVIEGRISEQQRASNEQYDFVSRQLSRKTDELNSALGNIKTIMDLTQTDYSNASASYNRQFDQAISTFNLIRGIQQDQKSAADRAQDNARANAQIYVNALKEGNIDLSTMAPDQKAQLNKLEVQAGFPVGFFASIRKDPKADIVATTSKDGQIQVLMRNASGGMTLQTYGTKTVGKDAVTKTEDKYMTEALSILKDADTYVQRKRGLKNPSQDKTLNQEEANYALNRITALVKDPAIAQSLFTRAWSVGGYTR